MSANLGNKGKNPVLETVEPNVKTQGSTFKDLVENARQMTIEQFIMIFPQGKSVKDIAGLEEALATNKDYSGLNLSSADANTLAAQALKKIEDSIQKNGDEATTEQIRAIDKISKASRNPQIAQKAKEIAVSQGEKKLASEEKTTATPEKAAQIDKEQKDPNSVVGQFTKQLAESNGNETGRY